MEGVDRLGLERNDHLHNGSVVDGGYPDDMGLIGDGDFCVGMGGDREFCLGIDDLNVNGETIVDGNLIGDGDFHYGTDVLHALHVVQWAGVRSCTALDCCSCTAINLFFNSDN